MHAFCGGNDVRKERIRIRGENIISSYVMIRYHSRYNQKTLIHLHARMRTGLNLHILYSGNDVL